MKLSKLVVAAAAVTLLWIPASLQGQDRLETILKEMEKAGRGITSLKADIHQKKYTVLLKQFDAGESGKIYFRKAKDGGAELRREISKPTPNFLVVTGGVATFFQPVINQVTVRDLGKDKDKAEFMVLGFGATTRALKETYNIRYLGAEKIDGKQVEKIELVPKSDKFKALFASIVMNLDTKRWIPVSNKLTEANGDYLLISFDDISLNPKLKDSLFKLKLPKNVQKVG